VAVKMCFVSVADKHQMAEIMMLEAKGELQKKRDQLTAKAEAESTELNQHLEAGWNPLYSGPVETHDGIAVVFILYKPDMAVQLDSLLGNGHQ
jgi:hypothetical protein